jgi:hypothetical protein
MRRRPVLAIVGVAAALTISAGAVSPAAAADKSSVTVTVTLSGSLKGSDYLVVRKAKLSTSTKFHETTMQVKRTRTRTDGTNTHADAHSAPSGRRRLR